MTVGTHHHQFDRLLNALGTLDRDEVVVQYGPGERPTGIARAEAFMPFDRMLACFREADVVVTHAGVGSILCATREGHVPLVVPRRSALGEHVDDHQVELARALAERGNVVAVWDTNELAAAVDAVPPRQPMRTAGRAALCAAVEAALRGDDEAQSNAE